MCISPLHPQLRSDLVELEFMHYDVGNKGSIPAVDFARSLVTCSDIRTVDMLLDKVCNMPGIVCGEG